MMDLYDIVQLLKLAQRGCPLSTMEREAVNDYLDDRAAEGQCGHLLTGDRDIRCLLCGERWAVRWEVL